MKIIFEVATATLAFRIVRSVASVLAFGGSLQLTALVVALTAVIPSVDRSSQFATNAGSEFDLRTQVLFRVARIRQNENWGH